MQPGQAKRAWHQQLGLRDINLYLSCSKNKTEFQMELMTFTSKPKGAIKHRLIKAMFTLCPFRPEINPHN